jgi:hypothetical protein
MQEESIKGKKFFDRQRSLSRKNLLHCLISGADPQFGCS